MPPDTCGTASLEYTGGGAPGLGLAGEYTGGGALGLGPTGTGPAAADAADADANPATDRFGVAIGSFDGTFPLRSNPNKLPVGWAPGQPTNGAFTPIVVTVFDGPGADFGFTSTNPGNNTGYVVRPVDSTTTGTAVDYGAGEMNMWNVLIGADGKIIASSLKGEELFEKVAEALSTIGQGAR